MRILWVKVGGLWPLNAGGRLRSFHIIAELSRLRRMSHRLIWLNPLLGSEGYEPVTRGMAAALPYTDDFLAAHNLEALDELGRLLAGLDKRRPVRR